MKTEELESHLREVLRERAGRVTEADLDSGLPGEERARPKSVRGSAGAWARPLTAAAVLLVVLALVTAGLMGRGGQTGTQTVAQGTDAGSEPGPALGARVWPLTNDAPLPGGVPVEKMQTPESAARAYLSEVVGLPADWPIEEMLVADIAATAKYVLQDVPAEVQLNRTAEGLWYVVYAQTQFIKVQSLGSADRVQVSIEPGPRMYEGGAPVKLTAVAADGRVLASQRTRVEPRRQGQTAAAEIVSLESPGREMPAALRAEVKDDHDGDRSTPEVTIGHWTVGLPALSDRPQTIPTGAEWAEGEPLFRAAGSPDEVAGAYMRDRFPDYPAPGIRLYPGYVRGQFALVPWETGARAAEADGNADDGAPRPPPGSGEERHASGSIRLRQLDGGWAVIAAETAEVDPSDIRVVDGRIKGRVTSQTVDSLSADVFQPDGTPAAGSPRPEGQPNAEYRFGTAGGPADGSLDIDVAVEPGSAVVRVNLVGGTILSITEFRMPVPQPER